MQENDYLVGSVETGKAVIGVTVNGSYNVEYENSKGVFGVYLSDSELEDCIRHLLDYAQDNGYFTYFAPKEN